MTWILRQYSIAWGVDQIRWTLFERPVQHGLNSNNGFSVNIFQTHKKIKNRNGSDQEVKKQEWMKFPRWRSSGFWFASCHFLHDIIQLLVFNINSWTQIEVYCYRSKQKRIYTFLKFGNWLTTDRQMTDDVSTPLKLNID